MFGFKLNVALWKYLIKPTDSRCLVGLVGQKDFQDTLRKSEKEGKEEGSNGEKLLMEEKAELQLADTSQSRMLGHPAPWIINLNCIACVVQWNQAPRGMGVGDYRVLNGHFSSVNNRLQEIPVHDSCSVYGCGWVCGDPSPWNATKARRWQSDGRLQPADTDNGDLCRESLLSPLPVSCLRTWDEITADCFQLPSRFHWGAYLSLWSSLRPERRTDFIIHSHSAGSWGLVGEVALLRLSILIQAAEYAVRYHMHSEKGTQKAERRNLQEMKVYRCTQLLNPPSPFD